MDDLTTLVNNMELDSNDNIGAQAVNEEEEENGSLFGDADFFFWFKRRGSS
jgi:hypothetical protein